MKQIAYAIYDKKTSAYSLPFFMVNDQTAIRSFAKLANDEQSTIKFSPEDYDLHRIGEYTDDNGVLTPLPIKSLVNATSLVKSVLNQPPTKENLAPAMMELARKNAK